MSKEDDQEYAADMMFSDEIISLNDRSLIDHMITQS